MARNRVYKRGDYLPIAATSPTAPVSGDALRWGERPGVCEVSEGSDGTCSASFVGVYNLSVQGFTTGGTLASAVAVGDILYYNDGAGSDAGTINKLSTAHRFGYAAGTVASGGTGTIPVVLGY